MAALIAFFTSPPFDPWWPDETTRTPQMAFAFVFWPLILVALAGLILYLAWYRTFRTKPYP